MKKEFYKMDFRAWNLGTVDLSLEQEAAYLRLCHAMYDTQGPIPNSTKLFCSLFRCGNAKAIALVRQLIDLGKIKIDEAGKLTNERVSEELVNRDRVSSARAVSGHRGGTASGVVRKIPNTIIDSSEALASTQRTRGEEIRGEENKKDGADAPVLDLEPSKPKSAEEQAKKEFYAECNQLFNGKGGGMATNLLKAKGGNIWQAMAALGAAKESGDPRSYIGGIVRKTKDYSPII